MNTATSQALLQSLHQLTSALLSQSAAIAELAGSNHRLTDALLQSEALDAPPQFDLAGRPVTHD